MLVAELAQRGVRMCGRERREPRETVVVSFDGLVSVRSGSTPSDSCVYLSFSKTKVQPYTDKPSEGIFQIGLEKGAKNDVLLNFLHDVYVRSKCVSMGDLCVRFGQEAYCVDIEIFPVQTDGDLFRLCVEGINEIIRILGVKTFFIPCVVQYAYPGLLVVDPSEDETEAARWKLTVVLRSSRELLLVEKSGDGVSIEEIFDAVRDAMSAVKAYNRR